MDCAASKQCLCFSFPTAAWPPRSLSPLDSARLPNYRASPKPRRCTSDGVSQLLSVDIVLAVAVETGIPRATSLHL